ncbi:isopentenyl-diphosphate Delta-isomerase [Stenotrophomonas sp. YAU14A_MKIMI4_1]|uniref:isopentenyl-diphosphate Delta-isomerase n=1 Tax=Stenotrophomonas sp. YAU14A_MKIMI4_1 TaxID=2072408 RepID=UPI000D5402F2|nr:isopentenyl-diphosphate Delta-isomerase [Stenotrophomonas sp. YAU14A_MKIMI4_1]AWH29585.1 isopentenyl-diphosphate delta-isomerase [Stenotrophomonas sp. YAU14A_MKIMI4_1]
MNNDVVLVDEYDRAIGICDKRSAHLGNGQLHRAFSVHLVDSAGRHLIQRRASAKMLWPGYWSNACCSHPAPGEAIIDAAERRLREELGIQAPCRRLYSFEYQASFGSIGAEHELCHVLVAQSDDPVRRAIDEISELRWLERHEVTRLLSETPGAFTPWFRMQWSHLSEAHSGFDAARSHATAGTAQEGP